MEWLLTRYPSTGRNVDCSIRIQLAVYHRALPDRIGADFHHGVVRRSRATDLVIPEGLPDE